jgi:phospholipid transport system substrate-binding protein
MKSFIQTFFLAVFLCVGSAHAQDSSPDALVKSTVNDVLSVLKENKDRRKLLELAEQKVLPHFDFTEMTRLAVGRAWRDASDPQKKSLENAFRALLVNTYTTALAQAAKSDQTVEVKPVRVQPGVTNYRSSFNSEVARGGIDGLIKSLEDKNRKVAAG